MNPIELNSNLSDESIKLTPISIGASTSEFELRVEANHWDGDHENSVKLLSESIGLSHEQLETVANKVKNWVHTGQAAGQPFSGEFELADDNANASLQLVFGDDEDIISADDKPVVTVTFVASRFSVQFKFVTDQSCLGIFAQQVLDTLAGIADD